MNEWFALGASALVLGAPLLLAALGEIGGEESGVLNVGLEGLMLMGAWTGAAAAWSSGHAFVGALAAMLAAMSLAAVFAYVVLQLGADAVVAGTGLNIFALGLTGVLHRALAARAGTYSAPTLSPWLFVCLGAAGAAALWWFLRFTHAGLRLRACGESESAASAAGVPVQRVRWLATLWCGALCGLGGAFLSMSHTNSFNENMTAGRGFIALALVVLVRRAPLVALLAALGFGAAIALQFRLQSALGDEWYPLLLALPYFLTLLALGARRNVRAEMRH
jgi:simple sugar transport system permease protein